MNTHAYRNGCPKSMAAGFDCNAAAMCLALPLSAAAAGASDVAEPASFQARLAQQQRDVQNRLQQPQWENRWLLAASAAAATESGDRRLHAIVAGYTRQALDRGGWLNRWVNDAHHAAPHPLVAVPMGQGVTTAGGVAVPAARYASL